MAERDEVPEIDWTELATSEPDGHQIYVFGFHTMIGIVISILSFNGDWIQWGIGTGFFTPIFLSGTGLFYAMLRGVNWYRDEFLPFVNRTLMNLEFENDRFLRYSKVSNFSCLIAGYLATVICQFLWTQIVQLAIPFLDTISLVGDLLFYVFLFVFILFLAAFFFFMESFTFLLKRAYSDIGHLIEIDDRMKEAMKKNEEDDDITMESNGDPPEAIK